MKSKSTLASNRRRRKMFTFLWIATLAIVTISLIYWEMTALLYILATLGVTALLVVVALSDLSKHEKTSDDPPRVNDSAAIGSGITSTFGAK
jgi:Flp pilus assembly protein TadB